MKIIREDELGTWTLVPVREDETQIIDSISTLLQPGDMLSSGGSGRMVDGFVSYVNLFAGSKEEEQTRPLAPGSNSTVTETVHVGGIKLVLVGDDEDSKYAVNGIRNACFFGIGSVIYLGTTTVEGVQAISITGRRCKLCSSRMISLTECMWAVCDNCASKCEHNYIHGVVQGPNIDLSMGYYCNLCGRGMPKGEGERKRSVLEQHLEVQRQTGIQIVYSHGEIRTPDHAIMVQRISRRLERSRRRSQRPLSNR